MASRLTPTLLLEPGAKEASWIYSQEEELLFDKYDNTYEMRIWEKEK